MPSKSHIYVRTVSPANDGLGCHQAGIKEVNVSGVALLSQNIRPVKLAEGIWLSALAIKAVAANEAL